MGRRPIVVPGVRFNEERNKQHKTGLFIQNTNIMHNGFRLGSTDAQEFYIHGRVPQARCAFERDSPQCAWKRNA